MTTVTEKSSKRPPSYLTESADFSKELENRFGITYLSELTFDSERVLQKVQKRAAKRLKVHKYHLMNQWVLSLFENEQLQKKQPPLLLRWVNPIVGYGVFTTKNMPTLTYIGEYTGRVRKRSRLKDSGNDYIFGYMVGPKDTPWVIDAEKMGNHTRFINHSYEPNLISRWVITSDGICHIILFSKRLIRAGEQLTYDYGPYYWRKRSYPLELNPMSPS